CARGDIGNGVDYW
nr:immunoglobulin heavy chain junction region [Macaca mulatta]MOX60052.1 immunoglobulin heavy chain junction region [Macaca mulatta]MOX60762.1 immunoglobulin heavy chain junction region [Macaca mulatta]MOX63512.1 immunoglobulin heavy chain junction region [Macaca mulatta]